MNRQNLRRVVSLLATLMLLLGLFLYLAAHAGPLAPVEVTTATAKECAITPSLFGIGTVEARYVYKIGPTYAGRLLRLAVDVGDIVSAEQVLGEMDPVDLDPRIAAQTAAIASAEATIKQHEAQFAFAETQARRYEALLAEQCISAEQGDIKRHELAVASATLAAAHAELARHRAEMAALVAQRDNLKLVAPCAGVVTARLRDPGTTVVPGESIVEIIDPAAIWIATRFDQFGAEGLRTNLAAQIVLRSRQSTPYAGHVARLEPLADAITEEMSAKVVFETIPELLPPLGELAEVTVVLPTLPAVPVISNASIQRYGGKVGIWKLRPGGVVFAPLKLGRADLNGVTQVLAGLTTNELFVVYSNKALAPHSRIRVKSTETAEAP